MVTRLLALSLVLALAGCSADGETCGLGRCKTGTSCITLFTGDFESKAEQPGIDVDNLYWCLGSCPKGKTCGGQCLENPIDDSVVVCAVDHVSMEMFCPAQLGVTVDGACSSFTVNACFLGSTQCSPNKTCPLGVLGSGHAVGPIGISVQEQGDPLFLDMSALSHTNAANPPLCSTLPDGVTPKINIPSSCD